MAGRRQISIEIGDDIPARFLDAHANAGKFGKRALSVECLSVGWAIKEMDPRLFRIIQASVESDTLTLDNLAVYLEACRQIGGPVEIKPALKPDAKPVRNDPKKTAAAGMTNLIV